MKQLGFGMMRLPLKDPKEQTQVDRAQAQVMVDAFLESGFTYVDTAYFYHGGESERVVKDILTSRYPRERYLLADKMPLANLKVKGTVEKQAAIFDEQLEKCGTAYFDRYLLHCLNAENYQIAQRLDTFSFLMKKKEEGKLHHLGFSFHDKAELLDQILTEHPETEFVQLQINYLDWEDERIQSRKCYETAVRHGKKVVVSAFSEQFFHRMGLFFFTRLATSLGTAEFGLYQLVMNVANLQGYTYDGFSVTATTMTGQCLGANDPEKAEK